MGESLLNFNNSLIFFALFVYVFYLTKIYSHDYLNNKYEQKLTIIGILLIFYGFVLTVFGLFLMFYEKFYKIIIDYNIFFIYIFLLFIIYKVMSNKEFNIKKYMIDMVSIMIICLLISEKTLLFAIICLMIHMGLNIFFYKKKILV